jgi:hypothetical protein
MFLAGERFSVSIGGVVLPNLLSTLSRLNWLRGWKRSGRR